MAGSRTTLRERLGRAWNAASSEFRAAAGGPVADSPSATAAAAPATPKRDRNMFAGAQQNRLTQEWVVSAVSPDDEVRGDMRLLRGRARELSRNSPHVGQYQNLLLSNVLGSHGMTLQAQVLDGRGNVDKKTSEMIEAAWEDYWSGPVSADGKLTGDLFEQLQLQTAAIEGESFTHTLMGAEFRHGIAVQGIDPDMIDETYHRGGVGPDPEVRMGVEIDQHGRPLGYWIWDRPMYMTYLPGQIPRGRYKIPASEMLHHYRPHRANQTRGVTWLARAMFALKMLDGYTEAELVAARTAAAKMGFLQWKDPALGNSDDAKPVTMEANPGSIEELPPGMEFQEWAPQHPNTAYGTFVQGILRSVASALGVNYNALANDLVGVNYSSMRAGLLIERELWQMLQGWWIRSFRQPMFEQWLQAATLSGALRLPNADWRQYAAVRWVPRGWDWVDPLKDSEADEVALRLGLTSRRRILAEQGLDFSDVLDELAEEKKLAAAAGVLIEAPQVGRPSALLSGDPAGPTDSSAADAAGQDSSANEVAAARARRAKPAA